MTEIIRRDLDDSTQLTPAERQGQEAFCSPRQRVDAVDRVESALLAWPEGNIDESAYTNKSAIRSLQEAVRSRYDEAAQRLQASSSQTENM